MINKEIANRVLFESNIIGGLQEALYDYLSISNEYLLLKLADNLVN